MWSLITDFFATFCYNNFNYSPTIEAPIGMLLQFNCRFVCFSVVLWMNVTIGERGKQTVPLHMPAKILINSNHSLQCCSAPAPSNPKYGYLSTCLWLSRCRGGDLWTAVVWSKSLCIFPQEGEYFHYNCESLPRQTGKQWYGWTEADRKPQTMSRPCCNISSLSFQNVFVPFKKWVQNKQASIPTYQNLLKNKMADKKTTMLLTNPASMQNNFTPGCGFYPHNLKGAAEQRRNSKEWSADHETLAQLVEIKLSWNLIPFKGRGWRFFGEKKGGLLCYFLVMTDGNIWILLSERIHS